MLRDGAMPTNDKPVRRGARLTSPISDQFLVPPSLGRRGNGAAAMKAPGRRCDFSCRDAKRCRLAGPIAPNEAEAFGADRQRQAMEKRLAVRYGCGKTGEGQIAGHGHRDGGRKQGKWR